MILEHWLFLRAQPVVRDENGEDVEPDDGTCEDFCICFGSQIFPRVALVSGIVLPFFFLLIGIFSFSCGVWVRSDVYLVFRECVFLLPMIA